MHMYMHYAHCTCIYIRFVTQSYISRLRYSDCTFLWEKTIGVFLRSRRGANIESFNMLFHSCFFICLEISTKMASVWGFWLWEAAEEPIQVISCQAFPILLRGGHTDWEYIWYLIKSFNILFQCCVFLSRLRLKFSLTLSFNLRLFSNCLTPRTGIYGKDRK